MDPLTKGGIETFNKRRVDHAFALRRLDKPFYHIFSTLHNPSLHIQDTCHSLFDHLHDDDVSPENQLASSRLAFLSRQLAAKCVPKGADVID